ncbi:MAG: MBL fold metallo-hydrolase [Anaerolineae bacterium]
MPELIVLGTAASVPDAMHDTIGLALRGSDWAVLIDCGGSSLHKLARHGVDKDDIRAVILTHRHPDHIYGLPALIQGLWLGGYQVPLPIYGPAEALNVARKLLKVVDLADREGMFALEWRPVPLREGRAVLQMEEVRISAAPAVHGNVQTMALRMENTASGRTIVYSADTEPCQALIRLATGADLLIHEATGEYAGHSSPAQAAEVALEAGVTQLVLIHYPVHRVKLEAWRRNAAEFPGPVRLAQDGDIYEL